MRALAAILLACTTAAAVDVSLVWDPVTNAVGYRVYWGTSSRNYTNTVDTGSANTATLTNLAARTVYYFAATAYTATGLESVYSKEAKWPLLLWIEVATTPAGPWGTLTNLVITTYTNPAAFYRLKIQ